MSVPSLLLKVIVCLHFFLSVWGTMSTLMPVSYLYLHLGVLMCGLWAIGAPQCPESVIMMLTTLCFSILQDIILLSLYEPRGYSTYERHFASQSARNEYRFALGMSILNLLLKPFSAFLLFRIYQSRISDTALNIPGLDRIPGLGGMTTHNGYEDMDRSAPSSPYTGAPVESASHHTSITKQ